MKAAVLGAAVWRPTVLTSLSFVALSLTAAHCAEEPAIKTQTAQHTSTAINSKEERLKQLETETTRHPHSLKLWKEKGELLAGMGRYEDAYNAYCRCLHISSKDAGIYFLRSSCLLHMGRSHQSLNDIETALKIDSANISYRKHMYGLHADLAMHDAALADMDYLLKQEPSAEHYLEKAQLLERMGNKHGALESVDKALELQPSLAAARTLQHALSHPSEK